MPSDLKQCDKFAVVQLGARMHYAVPRILERSGKLSMFYTDIHSTNIPDCLQRLASKFRTKALRQFLQRDVAISTNKIKSYPIFGANYFFRQKNAHDLEMTYSTYLWAGETINRFVNDDEWFDFCNSIYLFNTASLECAQVARNHQKKVFLEQCIIPAVSNFKILDREVELFPDWVINPKLKFSSCSSARSYANKEITEWEFADKIIAPSTFVKDLLVLEGATESKIEVVPYGVKMSNNGIRVAKSKIGKKLNVLCVGYVDIRKGAQYFYEVACKYHFGNFRYVGGFKSLPERTLRDFGQKVELTGHVDRGALAEHYQWADVFLFLSIGEGSATVIYEAISYGLPIITTVQAGSLLTNNIDGFIVDPSKTESIIDCLEKVRNPELMKSFEVNTEKLRELATFESYEQRLNFALNTINDK